MELLNPEPPAGAGCACRFIQRVGVCPAAFSPDPTTREAQHLPWMKGGGASAWSPTNSSRMAFKSVPEDSRSL